MQCECGYPFHEHTLDEPCPFASYAVVADKDYTKFLAAELEVTQAKPDAAKATAVWASAEHVGSLLHCPECSRYTLLHSDLRDGKITLVERAVDSFMRE